MISPDQMLANPTLVAGVLTAGLFPLLLTPMLTRWLIAHGQVDRPDTRRTHLGEIPRGGGVLIAAGLLAGLAMIWPLAEIQSQQGLVLCGLIISLVVLGASDDAGGIGVGLRFAVQVIIALLVIVLSDGVSSIRIWAQAEWSQIWVLSTLALISFLWLVNLHNFMDGSDGLAAQQAIWSALAYAAVFYFNQQSFEFLVALLLVASSCGFLIWNRPRARIFLGDSGSLVLGGLIAWFAIRALQTDSASLAICILISSVFVVDATATLLTRLVRGERWYTPHRSHAYQRLIDQGWSHARVLATYTGLNVLIVLPALFFSLARPALDGSLALGCVGVLIIGWWRIQSAYKPKEKGE